MTEIQIVETWEEIAKILYVATPTAKKRREKLFAAGVVFVKRKGRSRKRIICAYVDVLKAYRIKLQSAGEEF